ncbi:hypothetical protein [Streptomyces sp. NPDC059819]|uniref:hypothetical protein n=1 Tax=Streptomyces sp. NPDC059819 TaxID=3346963 RepID=UPI0036486004
MTTGPHRATVAAPPQPVTIHPEETVRTVDQYRLNHIPNNHLTTSTWWLVVTETGEHLLTDCPDASYAPVNVYHRGRLVPLTARSIVDPADHPDVRREVIPRYSPGAQYCRVPFTHPAVRLR